MEDVLYHHIFDYLGPKEILSCSTINKFFDKVVHSEVIWEKMFKIYFNDTSIFKQNYYESYKLCFCLQKLINICKYFGNIDSFYNEYYMDFTHTKLGIISPEMWYLKNLRTFKMCANKLDTLPIGISKLCNLNTLILTNNDLLFIPHELCMLNNLKKLDLSHNWITKIPAKIKELHNLNEIYLNNNKIVQIPHELGQLNKLQILFLNNNEIRDIPPELGNLCNLEELVLNDNKIQKIPLELGKLKNLKKFALYDVKMRYNSNKVNSIFVPQELGKIRIFIK